MREIEFMAWHNGQMLENCAVINGCLAIEEDPVNSEPTEDEGGVRHYSDWAKYRIYPDSPLMQYTGLKDRNGVKILEGDIVKIQYRFDSDLGPVGYSETETCFIWSPVGLSSSIGITHRRLDIGAYGAYGAEVEVIGNIHENPELIN